MKKKLFTLILSLAASAMLFSSCTNENLPEGVKKIQRTENSYIAETSSGDVVINFDEDGNIIEMIDANGDVIDLTSEKTKVELDEDGNVTAVVTPTGETVKVKEKATEKNSEDIIKKAEEKQKSEQKKAEEKKNTPQINEEKIQAELDEEIKQEQEKTKEEKTSEKKAPGSNNKGTAEGERPAPEKKVAETPEPKSEQPKDEPANGTKYLAVGGAGVHYAYESPDPSSKIVASLIPGIDDPITIIGKRGNDWLHVKFYHRGQTMDAFLPTVSLQDVEIESIGDDTPQPEAPSEPSSEKASEKASEQKSEIPSEQPGSEKPSEEQKPVAFTPPEGAVEGTENGQKVWYVYSWHARTDHLDQVNALRESYDALKPLTWNSGMEQAAADRLLDLVKNGHALDHSYGSILPGCAENLACNQSDYIGSYNASAGHQPTLLAGADCDASMVSICLDQTVYYEDGTVVTYENTNNILCVFY